MTINSDGQNEKKSLKKWSTALLEKLIFAQTVKNLRKLDADYKAHNWSSC
jgi:hypothetical protein